MQLWREGHRPTSWDTTLRKVGYGRRTKCERARNREKVHKPNGRLIYRPRMGTVFGKELESYKSDFSVKGSYDEEGLLKEHFGNR